MTKLVFFFLNFSSSAQKNHQFIYDFSAAICCSLRCRSAGANWCSELVSVKAEMWKKGEGLLGEGTRQLPFNGSVPTKERERSSNSTYWFLISILDCNLKAEIQLGFDLRQCLLIDCAAAAKTEFSIRTLNTVKVIVCTSLMYIWNKSSGSSKILAWLWNIWTWIIL